MKEKLDGRMESPALKPPVVASPDVGATMMNKCTPDGARRPLLPVGGEFLILFIADNCMYTRHIR